MKIGRKVPLVRQLGITDCGAACLTMIFQYYGCKVNINDIKRKLDTGRDGLSLMDMKKVSETFGFQFTAYEDYVDEENIINNLPLIMETKNNHYFIVADKIKTGYLINDPVRGKKVISFHEIMEECEKFIVKILPVVNIQKKISTGRPKMAFIKVNPILMVKALFLTLLTQCIVLIPSQIIQIIIDSGMNIGTSADYIKYFLCAIGILLIFYVLNLLKQETILTIQNGLYYDTMHKMIDKLFHINLKFYESHSSGDLQYRFNSINEIYDFISGLLITTVIEIITAVICGFVMLKQSVILLLVTVIIIFTQLIYISCIKRKLDDLIKNYMAERSKLEGRMVDTLVNIQQIRCMHLDNKLAKDLKENYDHVLLLLRKRTTGSNVLASGIGAVEMITPLLIYILGHYFGTTGTMTMGGLIAFVTLSSYFSMPFNTVAIVVPRLQNLKETIIRVEEFLVYNDEKNDTGKDAIEEFESLRLESVSFSYGSKKENLSNISMELLRGERIAVVGASGSGKSTLLKLIMNLMSNYSGRIAINDINMADVRRENVDRLFTIVTQTPVALNGTIKENIDIIGDISKEELDKALSLSEAKDFVMECPMGINTYIGENGQNISGGQKQRIAIARALAQNPEIVVFDEATSNLDIITEKKIYNNIKKEGVSQIVVTHRLHTIQDFDKIYVMDKGTIIEKGTHTELIKNRGLYYKMVCMEK